MIVAGTFRRNELESQRQMLEAMMPHIQVAAWWLDSGANSPDCITIPLNKGIEIKSATIEVNPSSTRKV